MKNQSRFLVCIRRAIVSFCGVTTLLSILWLGGGCTSPASPTKFSVHHHPFSSDEWDKPLADCEDIAYERFEELRCCTSAEEELTAIDRYLNADGTVEWRGELEVRMTTRLAFIDQEGRPVHIDSAVLAKGELSGAAGLRGLLRVVFYFGKDQALTLYYIHEFFNVQNILNRLSHA